MMSKHTCILPYKVVGWGSIGAEVDRQVREESKKGEKERAGGEQGTGFRILPPWYLVQAQTFRQRRQWHPTLAWKIPGMEEPGRRQSMGSLRVGHD